MSAELGQGIRSRASRTVGPVGDERVEGVGDRGDARGGRNGCAGQAVGVAAPVDPFVVVPDDLRDLGVVVHVREDALADHRVLLHLPPLFRRQRSRLLDDTRSDSDLSDVVEEPAEVRELLLLLVETEPGRDVARIDRDGSRVAGRVLVSRVERRDESTGEGQIGSLESLVHRTQVLRELALLLVQDQKPLRRERGHEEEKDGPRRQLLVGIGERRDDRRVERCGAEEQAAHRAHRVAEGRAPTKHRRQRVEADIREALGQHRESDREK